MGVIRMVSDRPMTGHFAVLGYVKIMNGQTLFIVVTLISVVTGCATHLVTKPWHTAPFPDPAGRYKYTAWSTVEELKPGMTTLSAGAFMDLGYPKSASRAPNPSLFTLHKGRLYEVVLKLSEDKSVIEDISYKCIGKEQNKTITDTRGPVEMSPQFASTGEFSEGLAWVKVENGRDVRFGYIDEKGALIIQPQFRGADDFSDGLARVWIDQKYGFVDKAGKLVIPARYLYAERFSDGLALANHESSPKVGYIDKTGNWVIKPMFSNGKTFFQGLAPVAVGDSPEQLRWGYIDKKAAFIVPPAYLWAEAFTIIHPGRAQVGIDTQHWGYIDVTGRIMEVFAESGPSLAH